jgi:hypothetical protein
VRCGKRNCNEIQTVATVVERNAKEVIIAPMMGPGRTYIWRASAVCSQAVGFVLVPL